jgi:DNA-binding Lrp family transcriptional regulator
MKKREMEVLLELLRDSKVSDRQLAQKLNTSQSTITRIRHRLEKKIQMSYTGIPNLSKLDIELISFICGKCTHSRDEISNCVEKMVESFPRIIFAGEGEGMKKTCIFVTINKDFNDFTDFLREFRLSCKGIRKEIESFLVPTKYVIRNFNLFSAVKDLIKEEKTKTK